MSTQIYKLQFYLFCERDKEFCKKIREDMTSGPSKFFTGKDVIDETLIKNSSNICKSVVGINASQLYPFSMCQDLPTGMYTRWSLTLISRSVKLDITELAFLREWSCLSIRKQDQNAI